MKKAGDYNARMTWLKQSFTRESDTGSELESWADNGYLWCQIDNTSGRKETTLGAPQTGGDVLISIRNYPAVSALDRLQYAGTTYAITHIRQGDNELIADCEYFDGGLVD